MPAAMATPIGSAGTTGQPPHKRQAAAMGGGAASSHSTAATHPILQVMAKSCLASALATRELKAAVFVSGKASDKHPFIKAAQEGASQYIVTINTKVKEGSDRMILERDMGQPHHSAWIGMVEASKSLITAPTDDEKSYWDYLLAQSYDNLQFEVHSCRVKNAYKKDSKRIEINCVPGTRAYTYLVNSIMPTFVATGGQTHAGTAAPGDLERQLQDFLEQQK
jgi:hypothetical protein